MNQCFINALVKNEFMLLREEKVICFGNMSHLHRANRYEQALSGQLAAPGAVSQPLIRSRGAADAGPELEESISVVWNVGKLTRSISSVYEAPLSGLSHISQILGKGALKCSSPFERVLLLGPHDCVIPFVEWYFAKSMPALPPNHWVAVLTGPESKVFHSEDAIHRFPQFKDAILHDNLCANFHVCTLSGGAGRSADGVEFIIPPRIEGVISGRSATHTELINQLRALLYGHASSIRSAFQSFDTNLDGILSKDEFTTGLVSLSSGISRSLAREVANSMDHDGSGFIDYEEFIGVFNAPSVKYSYDVEASVQFFCEICSDVCMLADVRSMDISGHYYSNRLVSNMSLASRAFPAKTFLWIFAPQVALDDSDLQNLHEKAAAYHFKKTKIKPLQDLAFVPVATSVSEKLGKNGIEGLCATIRKGFTASVMHCLRQLDFDFNSIVRYVLEREAGTGATAAVSEKDSIIKAAEARQLLSSLAELWAAQSRPGGASHSNRTSLANDVDISAVGSSVAFLDVLDRIRSSLSKAAVNTRAAFRAFDRDKDGFITESEFCAGCSDLNAGVNMSDVLGVWGSVLDRSGSGRINELDFCAAMEIQRTPLQQAQLQRMVRPSHDDDRESWVKYFHDIFAFAASSIRSVSVSLRCPAQKLKDAIYDLHFAPRTGLSDILPRISTQPPEFPISNRYIFIAGNGDGRRLFVERVIGRPLPADALKDPTKFTAVFMAPGPPSIVDGKSAAIAVGIDTSLKQLGRPSRWLTGVSVPPGGLATDNVVLIVAPTLEAPPPGRNEKLQSGIKMIQAQLKQHSVNLYSAFRGMDAKAAANRAATSAVDSAKPLLTGVLTRDECREGLKSITAGIGESLLGYVVSEMDLKKTDTINYEEFCAHFRPDAMEYNFDITEVALAVANLCERAFLFFDCRFGDVSGTWFSWKQLDIFQKVQVLFTQQTVPAKPTTLCQWYTRDMMFADSRAFQESTACTASIIANRMQVSSDITGISFLSEHRSFLVQDCINQLDAHTDIILAISNSTADTAIEILKTNMEFTLNSFQKVCVYPCIALDENLPSFINGEDCIFALQLLASSLSQTMAQLMIPSSYSLVLKFREVITVIVDKSRVLLSQFTGPLKAQSALRPFLTRIEQLYATPICGVQAMRELFGESTDIASLGCCTVTLMGNFQACLEFVSWYWDEIIPADIAATKSYFLVLALSDKAVSEPLKINGIDAVHLLPKLGNPAALAAAEKDAAEKAAKGDTLGAKVKSDEASAYAPFSGDPLKSLGLGINEGTLGILFPRRNRPASLQFVICPVATGLMPTSSFCSAAKDMKLTEALRQVLHENSTSVQAMFKSLDLDASGSISAKELLQVVKEMKLNNVRPSHLAEFKYLLESTCGGSINFDEFISLMKGHVIPYKSDVEGCCNSLAAASDIVVQLVGINDFNKSLKEYEPRQVANIKQVYQEYTKKCCTVCYVDVKQVSNPDWKNAATSCIQSMTEVLPAVPRSIQKFPVVYLPQIGAVSSFDTDLSKVLNTLLQMHHSRVRSLLRHCESQCQHALRLLHNELLHDGCAVSTDEAGVPIFTSRMCESMQGFHRFLHFLLESSQSSVEPWIDAWRLLLSSIFQSTHQLYCAFFESARIHVVANPVIDVISNIVSNPKDGLKVFAERAGNIAICSGKAAEDLLFSPVRIGVAGAGKACANFIEWYCGGSDPLPEQLFSLLESPGPRFVALPCSSETLEFDSMPSSLKEAFDADASRHLRTSLHIADPSADGSTHCAWWIVRFPELLGPSEESRRWRRLDEQLQVTLTAWRDKLAGGGSTWRRWLYDVLRRSCDHLSRVQSSAPDKAGRSTAIPAVVESFSWIYSRDSCGLIALGRLIGQTIPAPSFRKRTLFVVGCKSARRQILSSILGCPTESVGLAADFHVYSKSVSLSSGSLAADDFVSGSSVLRDIPGWARLSRHSSLQACIKSECRQFPAPIAECLIIVEAPDIQGAVRGITKWQNDALKLISDVLVKNSTNLLAAFRNLDVDKDGIISSKDFMIGITGLNLGFKPVQLQEILATIDLNADGSLHYEEFLAAFRPCDVEFPYNVESVVLDMAALADSIVLCPSSQTFDPTGQYFSAREVGLLEQIQKLFPTKTQILAFVDPNLHSSAASVRSAIAELGVQLASRCNDPSLRHLNVFFSKPEYVWPESRRFETPPHEALPDRLEDAILNLSSLADVAVQDMLDSFVISTRSLIAYVTQADIVNPSSLPVASRQKLVELGSLLKKHLHDCHQTMSRKPALYFNWITDSIDSLICDLRSISNPVSSGSMISEEFSLIVDSIRLLHLQSDSGIVNIGSKLGINLSAPVSEPVVVFLLGNSMGGIHVVGALTQQPLPANVVAACEQPSSDWTVIVSGSTACSLTSQQVLSCVGSSLQRELVAFPGLLDKLVGYQIADGSFFAGTVYIIAPNIDGNTGGNKDWHDKTLGSMRQKLFQRGRSLLSFFKLLDKDKDGVLSKKEFVDGLAAASLEVNSAELRELFQVVDLNGDNVVEWEEFLAAFRHVELTYPYPLEAVVAAVARCSDVIAAFPDPFMMDMEKGKFSIREVGAYRQLIDAHASKMRVFPYISPAAFKEEYIMTGIREVREGMSSRLDDMSILRAPPIWMASLFPAGTDFSPFGMNGLGSLFASVKACFDARIGRDIQATRTNISIAINTAADWRKHHDFAVDLIKRLFSLNAKSLFAAFRALDSDNDGRISEEEFKAAVKKLDPAIHSSDVDEMAKALDFEQGPLDIESFLTCFSPCPIDYAYDCSQSCERVAKACDIFLFFVDSQDSRSDFNSAKEVEVIRRLLKSGVEVKVIVFPSSTSNFYRAVENVSLLASRIGKGAEKWSETAAVCCKPQHHFKLNDSQNSLHSLCLSLLRPCTSRALKFRHSIEHIISSIGAQLVEKRAFFDSGSLSTQTFEVIRSDYIQLATKLCWWLHKFTDASTFPWLSRISESCQLGEDTIRQQLASYFQECRLERSTKGLFGVIESFVNNADQGFLTCARQLDAEVHLKSADSTTALVIGPDDAVDGFMRWYFGVSPQATRNSAPGNFHLLFRSSEAKRYPGSNFVDILPNWSKLYRHPGVIDLSLIESFSCGEQATDSIKFIIAPSIESTLDPLQPVPYITAEDLEEPLVDWMRADVIKEEGQRAMWAAHPEEEPTQFLVDAISLQRGIPALEAEEAQGRVGDPLHGLFVSLNEKFQEKWQKYYSAAINKFSQGGISSRRMKEREVYKQASQEVELQYRTERFRARLLGYTFCQRLRSFIPQIVLACRSADSNGTGVLMQSDFRDIITRIVGSAIPDYIIDDIFVCIDAIHQQSTVEAAQKAQAAAHAALIEKRRIEDALKKEREDMEKAMLKLEQKRKEQKQKGEQAAEEVIDPETQAREQKGMQDEVIFLQSVIAVYGNHNKAFSLFDRSSKKLVGASGKPIQPHTNRISQRGFRKLVRSLPGLGFTESDIRNLMKRFDWDSAGFGYISRLEWNKKFDKSPKEPEGAEKEIGKVEDSVRDTLLKKFSLALTIFRVLDTDKDDFITFDEFRSAMKKLKVKVSGVPLTSEQIEILLQRCQVDRSNENCISYKDFVSRYSRWQSWRGLPGELVVEDDAKPIVEDDEDAVIEDKEEDEDDAKKKSDYFMDVRRRKQEAAKARAELLKSMKADGQKRTCPALQLWILSQCSSWSPARGTIDWQSFLKTIAVPRLKYDFNVEAAVSDAASLADTVIAFVDPLMFELDNRYLKMLGTLSDKLGAKLQLYLFLGGAGVTAKPAGLRLEAFKDALNSACSAGLPPQISTVFLPEGEGLRAIIPNSLDVLLQSCLHKLDSFLSANIGSLASQIRLLLGETSLRYFSSNTSLDGQKMHRIASSMLNRFKFWINLFKSFNDPRLRALLDMCTTSLPALDRLIGTSNPIARFGESINEIHNHSQNGLHALGKKVGCAINTPTLEKSCVLVLGNNAGPARFLQYYCGEDDARLFESRPGEFALFTHGNERCVLAGSDAVRALSFGAEGSAKAHFVSHQSRRIRSISHSFTLTTIPNSNFSFEMVTFVRSPLIAGLAVDPSVAKEQESEGVMEFQRLVNSKSQVIMSLLRGADPDASGFVPRDLFLQVFADLGGGILSQFSPILTRVFSRQILIREGNNIEGATTQQWTTADEEALTTSVRTAHPEIMNVFSSMDVTGKGVVDQHQFVTVLKRVASIPQRHKDQLLQRADTDFITDGTLDYVSFFKPFEPVSESKESLQLGIIEDIVRDAFIAKYHLAHTTFQVLDKSKSGKIARREFALALHKLKLGVPADMLELVATSVDADKDGSIDYKEFIDRFSTTGRIKPLAASEVEIKVKHSEAGDADRVKKQKEDAAAALEAARKRRNQMNLFAWLSSRASTWLSDQGHVLYEAVLSDCRPILVKFDYDDTAAVTDLSDVADHILYFVDPRSMDVASPQFSSKEAALIETLNERNASKLTVVCFLDEDVAGKPELSSWIADLGASLAVRLRDKNLMQLPVMFTPADVNDTGSRFLPSLSRSGIDKVIGVVEKSIDTSINVCLGSVASNVRAMTRLCSENIQFGKTLSEKSVSRAVADHLKRCLSDWALAIDSGDHKFLLTLKQTLMECVAMAASVGESTESSSSSSGAASVSATQKWTAEKVAQVLHEFHEAPRRGLHFLSDTIGTKVSTPVLRTPTILLLACGCDADSAVADWLTAKGHVLQARRAAAPDDTFISLTNMKTEKSVNGLAALDLLDPKWKESFQSFPWIGDCLRGEQFAFSSSAIPATMAIITIPSAAREWRLGGLDDVCSVVSLHVDWIVKSCTLEDKDQSGFIARRKLERILTTHEVGLRSSQVVKMLEAAGLQDEERIMFKQFVNSFRSASSKRDMNKFVAECASLSDSTFIFVNPASVRYSVREMSLVTHLRSKYPSKVSVYGFTHRAQPDLLKQLRLSSEAVDKLMGSSMDRVIRCCCVPDKRAADVYSNILAWKTEEPAEGSLRPIAPLLVDEAGASLALNDIDIACRRMQKSIEMRVLEATEVARKNVKSMLRSISQQFDAAEESRRTELLQAIRLIQSNLVAIAAECDIGGISTFLRDFATEGAALCASLEATFTSLKQLGTVPSALDFAKELLLTAGGHRETGKQKKDKTHSGVSPSDASPPSATPSQVQAAAPLPSETPSTADAISLQQLAESASQQPAKATLPEALALLQYQQKILLRYLKAADTKKSGKLNKVAVVKVLSTFNLQPDVISSIFKLGNPDPAGNISIEQFLKAIDANVAAKAPKKESTVTASSTAEALDIARSAHPLSSNWAVAVSGRRPGPLPPSHLAPATSVDSSLAPSMGAVTNSSTVAYGNSSRASGDRTAIAGRIADTIDRVASRVPDPRPLSSEVRDLAIRNSTVHGAAVPRHVQSAAVALQTKQSSSVSSFANEFLNFPRFKAALEELYLTPTHGLSAMTLSAQLPSCPRVVFLVIGNGAGRRAVVEQYCGIKIRAPGHSHDSVIRVLVPGDGNVELNAAQAVAAVPGLAEELEARSIAVDDSIIVGCTYPAAERQSSGAVFVLAPHIDGRTASDHAPTNQTLVAVRAGIKRTFPSLKEAFESADQRNTGFIGPVGFAELISELNVEPALQDNDISDLFECVDLNSDGFVEYEEFLSAFRSVTVVCSAVVEDILDAVSSRAASVVAVLNPLIMEASGEHFSIRDIAVLAKCHRSGKCLLHCYIDEREMLQSETGACVRRCREGMWKRLRLPDSIDLPCIHAATKLKASAGLPGDCSQELFGRINLAVDEYISGILQHVKLDLARCCSHARSNCTAKELAGFFQWISHWSRDNVVSGDAAMRRLAALCKASLADVSAEIENRKLKKQEDAALKGRVADALKQASSVLAKRPQFPGL